jgi:SAM-dependent methyltransferase
MATAQNTFANYQRADFRFDQFPQTGRVLDIGCGSGRHLFALRDQGCSAFGVEPNAADAESCRQQGFEVLVGTGERLPVADRSVEGVVSCVVVPYTDERRSVTEWARVLASGGEVRASYIGAGYALRYMLVGCGLRQRLYGARTLFNTWVYRLTGHRLPGSLGDTLYQSERRLKRYYAEHGFELVTTELGKRFLGLPVLIYHHLRKSAE